jgi:hypothetical protein
VVLADISGSGRRGLGRLRRAMGVS